MDLTYTQDKMFTRFIAQSKEGETAWREMAVKMNGVASVFNFDAHNVILQLRRAGYKVGKAKPISKKEIDNILNELGI
jgi:hypothetical protein